MTVGDLLKDRPRAITKANGYNRKEYYEKRRGEIYEKAKKGIKLKDLALEYGLHKESIRNILSQYRYKVLKIEKPFCIVKYKNGVMI